MKHLATLAFIGVAAALGGCATTPIAYPDYAQSPTVVVSGDTVSTVTETPAEDFLLPNSQVFIAGKGGFAPFLGLLGIAIDRSRNETAVSGSADALRLKFNEQFSAALKQASASAPSAKSKVSLVASGGDITMVPAARLVLQDESNVDLSFRVTVRFADPVSRESRRKEYWHAYDRRPLAGWTDNNSAALKEASTQALPRLAQVILEDVGGNFRDSLTPEKRRVIRYESVAGGGAATAVLLKDLGDHLVLMPMIGDTLLHAIVFIVPKRALRIQS